MESGYNDISHDGSHHCRDDVRSPGGGFDCIEVLTGARRRRQWSDEEKLAIIAESFSTSSSVSAVARRHGIDKNQLFQWRRQFRDGAFGEQAGLERLDFATVAVGTATAPTKAASRAGTSDGDQPDATMIEIVVGAVTVRVPLSADEGALRRVLGVVVALG